MPISSFSLKGRRRQNTSGALMVVGRQIHKLMIKITILYTGGELNRAY
jgi:hypothetical protein